MTRLAVMVLLGALLFAAGPNAGQTQPAPTTGALHGRVSDELGAAISRGFVLVHGGPKGESQQLQLNENGEFDVCTLFYARFKSVISQIPTAQQLIPAEVGAREETGPVYYYEPDEDEILAQLLPRAVTVRIYRALLENGASFFGAQMSAMDNATRNAGEMVKKYTLRYNRTRQAIITKELIEIISGAEAL